MASDEEVCCEVLDKYRVSQVTFEVFWILLGFSAICHDLIHYLR